MIYISNIMIPLLVLLVLIYGMLKKQKVYDVFIEGTKEGIEIGFSIFPALLAMIFSVNILLSSGFIDFLVDILNPLFSFLKVPIEIIPMAMMRPISGNTSLALMTNVFSKYGVDTFLGILASTIQGCSDTTLYILTLYFGTIGIKKIKYAMIVGLISDAIGIIISILIVKYMFY